MYLYSFWSKLIYVLYFHLYFLSISLLFFSLNLRNQEKCLRSQTVKAGDRLFGLKSELYHFPNSIFPMPNINKNTMTLLTLLYGTEGLSNLPKVTLHYLPEEKPHLYGNAIQRQINPDPPIQDQESEIRFNPQALIESTCKIRARLLPFPPW